MNEVFDRIQDILNRMKKAHEDRKGLRLSIDDLDDLSVSFLGQTWSEEDPRDRK